MQMLLRMMLLALVLAASTYASAININKPGTPNPDISITTHHNTSLEPLAMSPRAPAIFGAEYTGIAVVEMSIASDDRKNIGDLNRAGLYHVIYTKLVELCPDDQDECDTEKPAKFTVKWLSNAYSNPNPFPQNDGWAELRVTSFRFMNNKARRLLIGSIAGAYEAMTDTERNCFDLTCEIFSKNRYCKGKFDPHLSWDSTPTSANNDRFCSVASKVSVFTIGGHLSIEFDSKWHEIKKQPGYHMGAWRCCETRDAIDDKLEGLKDEMISVFGEHGSKFRDVQCSGGCREDQRESRVNVDEILKDVINHLG